jgi:hypothetical protein
MVAPFSKLDENTGKMLYNWNTESGSISVGNEQKGIDQTGQIDALVRLLDVVESISKQRSIDRTERARIKSNENIRLNEVIPEGHHETQF